MSRRPHCCVDGYVVDEAAIVRDLRAGLPGAFERAYALHERAIYTFLVRLTRQRDVADDLFQETWVRLQKHRARLLPDTRLLPWLLTVARNLHRSYLRWRILDLSRFFEADEALGLSSEASPDVSAEVRQELEAVERALGAISAGARELLLVSSMQELAPSEIQAMLHLSPEAYRQRLSRARKELRDAMRKP